MAISMCPKCSSSSFEVKIQSPSGSNYKVAFIQCRSCGCVVGAQEYYNVGTLVKDLEKKVDALSMKISGLNSVNNNMNIINNNVLEIQRQIRNLK